MPTSAWSTTAASNGSTLGIDIAENCDAANINNALREMMAQLKTKIDAIDALIAAGSLGATLTALEAVTTAANKLIYATGVDTFSTTDFSSFARTLLDDGDAATAQNTLGAVGIVASSIVAGGGYIKFNIGGTTFILQWIDGTASANTTTAISYPTAFASWSRAVCSGGDAGAGAEENNPIVSSTSTTAATVASARDASTSVTIFAWGV